MATESGMLMLLTKILELTPVGFGEVKLGDFRLSPT
jgi:hypothetical protein